MQDSSEEQQLVYVNNDNGGFCQFIYNKHTGAFLGRTKKSWTLIGVFYLIYYLCLAGFFIGMLQVFLQFIIPFDKPMRTGENSILQLKAGMGFRPLTKVDQTLIGFNEYDPSSYANHLNDIDGLLLRYHEQIAKSKSSNMVDCPLDGKRSDDDINKLCRVKLAEFGDCTRTNDYGYGKDKPCIFIKINRIYGWIPDIKNGSSSNNPLVQCTGQNPADKENFDNNINYFPEKTVDGKKYGVFNQHYFPYLGQPSYLSPLVALQLNKPLKNTLMLIECSLVNVKNANDESLKFEVRVDQVPRKLK